MPRRLKAARFYERVKERRRRLTVGVLASYSQRGQFFFTDYYPAVPGTIPEKMLFAELMKRQVNFFFGFFFGDIPWTEEQEKIRPDFILPDYRIIIEVLGSYWHTRPGKFEYDTARYILLRSAGYEVHLLTDDDIIRNVVEAVNQIPQLINPLIRGNFFAVEQEPFHPVASAASRIQERPRIPNTSYKKKLRGKNIGVVSGWKTQKGPAPILETGPLFDEKIWTEGSLKLLGDELAQAGPDWLSDGDGTRQERNDWWYRFSLANLDQLYAERFWWI